MSPVGPIDHAAIRQHCRHLRLPTVAAQFDKLAQEALKERQTHVSYLASLLGAEVDRIASGGWSNAECMRRTCHA